MNDDGMGKRPGQPGRYDALPFDLLDSKLRPPQARPGTVCRSSLIGRLAGEDSRPIVSVVAPAGYGKTTLLSQWVEHGGRAMAWLSVDEKDNDPKILLGYVARALDAVQPVGQPVFDALASPASSVPGSVVPRLGNAFSSMTVPVALVLDDVHLLHDTECRAALSVLADHVPAGSRLVLAGRDEPPLRLARLRAEGRVLEIGPADLALTREEAALLLRAAQVILGEEDVAELHRRAEGWPVGLYLAALYLREGGSLASAVNSFDGRDRFVSEYMQSEFLEQIPAGQRAFLTRAAVLERMSGELCEAVLEVPGAAATLAGLARSNMLLVPLDRRGIWYRYHHLFRDMLFAELERAEPGLIPVLRRRAAGWCLGNDLAEEALEYAIAVRDTDTAADLVARLAVPKCRQGQIATLRRWFGWLDREGGIDGHPMVAVLATLIYSWMGQPAETERWADAVDRWQHGDATRPDAPAVQAWAALARAFLCRAGIVQMRADASDAARGFEAQGIVTPGPALLQGFARILAGDPDGGEAALEEAVSLAQRTGGHKVMAQALAERSLLAMARSHWGPAEDLAAQARAALDQAGIEENYVTPLVCAAQARAAMHRGDTAAARQQLIGAQRVRSVLTYTVPYVAVQARIELARVHVALADPAGARTLIREIDEILRCRPDLGILVGQARQLRADLTRELGHSLPGASALTAAELRVLPLLATHLSYPEIAAELSVSPNTIKSQAYSLFRKLGASSRSQAVARSRELALLEG
jgi:LuxR family maltose regulon positive regulatory protein